MPKAVIRMMHGEYKNEMIVIQVSDHSRFWKAAFAIRENTFPNDHKEWFIKCFPKLI
jgi:hypothetical protein